MKRVIWTRQALEDVEAIRLYVARDSDRYATLLVERLVMAVERAGRFPESGRVVPEVGDPTLREIVHGSYRILYRLTREAIEIVTVHHGARLFRL